MQFEFDVDKKLHKGKVTSLVLKTTIRGACNCYANLENPPSNILVPTLK